MQSRKKPNLPIAAEKLIPHRPPMLLAGQLLERDREADTALVAAEAPTEGVFIDEDRRLVPEYYIELAAQAAGLANGYDRLMDGIGRLQGFLTGLGDLRWLHEAPPGADLLIRVRHKFAFGNIRMITTNIHDQDETPLFEGIIKVWENNE